MSAHDAGREMDAIIAERVMGWTWRTYWRPEEARALFPPRYKGSYTTGDAYPEFSTDITAAFDVLAQLGGIAKIARMAPDDWRVEIGSEVCWAETLPLAICRASLAAIEVPA